MEPPPGLIYLIRVLPDFSIPSAATYVALLILQHRKILFNVPYWLTIVVSILARLVIFVISRYHSWWANKRAAAANGATIASYLKKFPRVSISEMVSNMRYCYPGESNLCWLINLISVGSIERWRGLSLLRSVSVISKFTSVIGIAHRSLPRYELMKDTSLMFKWVA